MRFVLVILIWIVFVGGLAAYTNRRAEITAAPESLPPALDDPAGTRLSLELTPTFSGAVDPFALRSDAEPAGPLTVRINGIALRPIPGELRRGQPLLIEALASVQAGTNEILVTANPPMEDGLPAHGIRVRVLDGRRALTDRTIWADGGALVSGVVSFELGSGGTNDH